MGMREHMSRAHEARSYREEGSRAVYGRALTRAQRRTARDDIEAGLVEIEEAEFERGRELSAEDDAILASLLLEGMMAQMDDWREPTDDDVPPEADADWWHLDD